MIDEKSSPLARSRAKADTMVDLPSAKWSKMSCGRYFAGYNEGRQLCEPSVLTLAHHLGDLSMPTRNLDEYSYCAETRMVHPERTAFEDLCLRILLFEEVTIDERDRTTAVDTDRVLLPERTSVQERSV